MVFDFNSIKVRLEHFILFLVHSHSSYFNSIKVRLEHRTACSSLFMDSYFNSIKVRLELQFHTPLLLQRPFQFHKGAIRTNRGRHRQRAGGYFNSIKVRLEHRNRGAFRIVHLFQFHKGAIRTQMLSISILHFAISIP